MSIGMISSGALAEALGWPWTMTAYAGAYVLLLMAVLLIKLRETLSSCTKWYSKYKENGRLGRDKEANGLLLGYHSTCSEEE